MPHNTRKYVTETQVSINFNVNNLYLREIKTVHSNLHSRISREHVIRQLIANLYRETARARGDTSDSCHHTDVLINSIEHTVSLQATQKKRSEINASYFKLRVIAEAEGAMIPCALCRSDAAKSEVE